MHSALFEWGDLCTKQCRRKSCLYLHRNCSRTVCPCETITSVPSLSPPTPPQPRLGRAKAIWPWGWNYTSAARLDAKGLFVPWLWAFFSFLLLPSCSLPPLIFFRAQVAIPASLKNWRSLEEQKMTFWIGQGVGGRAGLLSHPGPTWQRSWAGDRWQFPPGISP